MVKDVAMCICNLIACVSVATLCKSLSQFQFTFPAQVVAMFVGMFHSNLLCQCTIKADIL